MRPIAFIISLFLAGIFYASLLYYNKKKVIYSDDNTEDKCKDSGSSKFVEGSECHIWDNNKCRRGKYEKSSSNCISKGDYIPLILMLLSLSFLISSVLCLFL